MEAQTELLRREAALEVGKTGQEPNVSNGGPIGSSSPRMPVFGMRGARLRPPWGIASESSCR